MTKDRAQDRAKRDAKVASAPTVVLHFAPYGPDDFGAALVVTWERVRWAAVEVERVAVEAR